MNKLFARSGLTFAAVLVAMPGALHAYSTLPDTPEVLEASASDYPRETLSSRLQRIKQHYRIGLTFDQKKAAGVMVPPARQVSAEQDIANSVNSSRLFTYSKSGRLYTVYPKAGSATTATRIVRTATATAVPQQSRQGGTLTGTVLDKDGAPIAGAIVRITGTQKGASTDVKGQFRIPGVPAGKFTVEVSCISYATMRVSDVSVGKGQTRPLDVILQDASKDLKEVVVTATYNNANASALYARQKNMVAMSDGISADMMKKTADNNMAQVLKRVSGVTIEGGKFINVRGMGERYNNVELNGTTLPSTEPNRRNFAFDLIPSNLVDNVTIAKTFTPDMQGEFTGGLVNVSTLSIPRERIIQLSMGTGFNSISTGKDFYGGRRLDGDYFLGNNKDRDWFNRDWVNDTYATFIDDGGNIKEADKQKAYDMNARIPNHWGLGRFTGKPTQNYAFTFGQPFTLRNGDKLGVIVSGTYRHEENAQDMAPSKFRKYEEFMKQGNGYKFATAVGAIANIGYEHGGHKITWSNMFNNRFTQNNTQRVVLFADDKSATTGIHYLEQYSSPLRNVLWQTRLEGEHRFLQDTWILNWFADYNKMTRGQHDDRFMRGVIMDYSENMPWKDMMVRWRTSAQTAFDLSEGHIMYNNLTETKKNLGFNLSRSFIVEGNKQVVKAGYWGTFRNSNYEQQYLTPLLNGSQDWTQGLNIGQVFAPESFKEGKLIYKQGGQWGPIMDYYRGKQTVHAAYIMGEFTFLKKLHLTTGVRMEKSKMTVSSYFLNTKTALPKDSTVTNDKTDFLPAATLVYNLTDNLNLRAAYGKTLARPEFRELTRFRYYNVADRMDIQGFPLENSYIHNYDVRVEWYPEAGEVLSLGFFYKKFKKPIEMITARQSGGNMYSLLFNLDDATTKGIEFNLRKSFGFLAPTTFLKDLYLNANITWLSGNVNYNFQALLNKALGLNIDETTLANNNRHRPLMGMAPFIVNAGLSYSGKWFGAALNYGTTGRRIVTAGSTEEEDEYEKSRSLLDAQISVKPLKNLEVKFNASDLLNQTIIVYANTPLDVTDKQAVDIAKNKDYQKGVDTVRGQYKVGTSYSLSISYTF